MIFQEDCNYLWIKIELDKTIVVFKQRRNISSVCKMFNSVFFSKENVMVFYFPVRLLIMIWMPDFKMVIESGSYPKKKKKK